MSPNCWIDLNFRSNSVCFWLTKNWKNSVKTQGVQIKRAKIMAFQTLIRQAYLEMPPVTRAYTTACVLTTMAVQLDLLSPFQLYFNPVLVWTKYQFWRMLTTFLFFGTFGFNFFFNMIFTYRYCRMLEENSFRGRTADFVTMFIFGSVFMIFAAYFVNLLFLGM